MAAPTFIRTHGDANLETAGGAGKNQGKTGGRLLPGESALGKPAPEFPGPAGGGRGIWTCKIHGRRKKKQKKIKNEQNK